MEYTRQDSNLQPSVPKTDALSSCATGAKHEQSQNLSLTSQIIANSQSLLKGFRASPPLGGNNLENRLQIDPSPAPPTVGIQQK
jgi:hypothetical protein